MITKLYRYERDDQNGKVFVNLFEYEVIKETPKGYWIQFAPYDKKHWVSKTSKKKFAYLDKETAWINWKLRTRKHINILEERLMNAKIAYQYGIEEVGDIEKAEDSFSWVNLATMLTTSKRVSIDESEEY